MPKRSRQTDHAEQVDRLLAQANTLPHGPTRIELCEEAARIADLHNDPELAYRAREELVEAACFGGRPDLLLVGFSWCLSTFDRNPDGNISAFQLLWRMKWVAGALTKFPDIELKSIYQMLDDMERRFVEFGGSRQPALGKRRMVALQTGDFEAAAATHKKFMRMPRTFLSDCHACERNALAGYWMDIGKISLGVRKAEELIHSGMRCASVPDGTYADVLLPMVKMGRAADAMKYHKKGYPLIRRDVGDLWHWGQHMAYLSLTGNDARAVKLLETHLPDVEASHDPLGSLVFFRGMLTVVEGLADKKEKTKLRMPPESPFANESGVYVLADLAREVRNRTLEISRLFDRRNGNSYYEGLVDQASKLRRKATRVPFDG
jgi:hypothetical protein